MFQLSQGSAAVFNRPYVEEQRACYPNSFIQRTHSVDRNCVTSCRRLFIEVAAGGSGLRAT